MRSGRGRYFDLGAQRARDKWRNELMVLKLESHDKANSPLT